MQPDLYVGDADAERLSGLVDIQFFDIAQKKDLPVNLGQRLYRLLDQCPHLFPFDRLDGTSRDVSLK